jgi:hypothetical protein
MSKVWVVFILIWAVAEFIAAMRRKDFRGRMKVGAIWAVGLTSLALVGQMSSETSAIVQFLVTSIILGFLAVVVFYIRVFLAGIWRKYLGGLFTTSIANIKSGSAVQRKNEEELYEVVAQEMADGERRTGLWLKALEKAEGDEGKQVSEYIKLRVQSLKDEMDFNSQYIPSDKCLAQNLESIMIDEELEKDLENIALDEKKRKEEGEELKRIKIEKIIQEKTWHEFKREHFKPLNSFMQSRKLGDFVRNLECENFPLHRAVYDGDIELVKVLIFFRFDVSLLNSEGRSIRDAAAGNKRMIHVVENTNRSDLVDQNFIPGSFVK